MPRRQVLVGTLSVRETLTYAALLRLPGDMSHEDKVTSRKPFDGALLANTPLTHAWQRA